MIALCIMPFLLCFDWGGSKQQCGKQIETRRDTITIVKYDTVTICETKYITNTVIDTLYIRDTVLVREQRRYFEDGMYEAFVSGYDPTLDSLRVFPKTIENTITEYRDVVKNDDEWHLYIGGGINTNFRQITPQVNFTVRSPFSTMFSANIGYNNGLFVGMTIQQEVKW